MSGRLYGIGVGPGDPELMTLKAVRILARGSGHRLSGAEQRRKLGARHRRKSSFRRAGSRSPSACRCAPGPVPLEIYDRAAEEIADASRRRPRRGGALRGRPVLLRLVHVSARPRWPIAFPTTIVPGVTSLTACAAASGRPLVRRDDVLTVAARDARRCGARAAAVADARCRGDHEGRPASAAPAKRCWTSSACSGTAIYVAHATRGNERVVAACRSCRQRSAVFLHDPHRRGTAHEAGLRRAHR